MGEFPYKSGSAMWRAERGRYSTAAVIQAACNIITVAINGSADKEGAMQATQRWMKTSRERAKARDHSTHYRKQYVYS